MFRRFDYVRPSSLGESIDILSSNPQAQVLAGGTDLLLRMREAAAPGTILVDLKGCADLRGIENRKKGLYVGALTTITEILESAVVRERYRALWDAAAVFGCYEIRNRATIGGNVVHASPGAESGTPLFVFEARVEITGPRGVRWMAISDFWYDAAKVRLDRGEVLSGFLLPPQEEETESRYLRISRTKGMDLASLGVSVAVVAPREAKRRDVRVAMAAVERVPYRSPEVESLLSRRPLDDHVVADAKELMASSIHPRDTSLRAAPAYKRAMVGTLAERILDELGLIEHRSVRV